MIKTREGGSVLGFVVIGGILALLLVGGVYVVRQNSAVTANPSPTPAREQTSEQPPAKENKETAQNDKQPEKSEPQAEEKQKESPPAREESMADAGANKATELPRTGAAETFVAILMLSLLTGTASAYVQSRRNLASL